MPIAAPRSIDKLCSLKPFHSVVSNFIPLQLSQAEQDWYLIIRPTLRSPFQGHCRNRISWPLITIYKFLLECFISWLLYQLGILQIKQNYVSYKSVHPSIHPPSYLAIHLSIYAYRHKYVYGLKAIRRLETQAEVDAIVLSQISSLPRNCSSCLQGLQLFGQGPPYYQGQSPLLKVNRLRINHTSNTPW